MGLENELKTDKQTYFILLHNLVCLVRTKLILDEAQY